MSSLLELGTTGSWLINHQTLWYVYFNWPICTGINSLHSRVAHLVTHHIWFRAAYGGGEGRRVCFFPKVDRFPQTVNFWWRKTLPRNSVIILTDSKIKLRLRNMNSETLYFTVQLWPGGENSMQRATTWINCIWGEPRVLLPTESLSAHFLRRQQRAVGRYERQLRQASSSHHSVKLLTVIMKIIAAVLAICGVVAVSSTDKAIA